MYGWIVFAVFSQKLKEMDVSSVKKICLEGSRSYYNYLAEKPNSGVEEVEIRKIDRINNSTYKLKIDKKLFDPDSVCFAYNGRFRAQYTSDQISIKVYDNDKRVLIVKVSEEVQPLISDLVAKNWVLIIDLKFLIQRVIDWYETNGNRLVFNPGRKSKNNFDESVFLPNAKPSDEQRRALDTVFTQHFSYIWGAPGTGKTRFVLSYSILHYIKRNDRVLVLAPTNVALEQVLSGVIGVTDIAGVSRKKILRLGFPTKEFADNYGEICEIQGLEKELKRVNNQISIVSSVLGIKSSKQLNLEDLIDSVKRGVAFQLALKKRKANILAAEKEIANKELLLNRKKSEQSILELEKHSLIEKKNSILGKVFNFLSKKVNYEEELNNIITRELDLNGKIEHLIVGINQDQQVKQAEVKKKNWIEAKLKVELTSLEQAKIIASNGNVDLNHALNTLQKALKKESERLQIYSSLSEEYEKYSDLELKEILNKLKREKEKLENYSLEARIESSQVIGATIDTFLHRFKEATLDVAHIFVDEAGYANVVKALTVFTKKIPITFLGDHKQLPPVCELSKLDIQRTKKYHNVFVWDQSAIFIGELWQCANESEALKRYFSTQEPSRESIPRASLTRSYRFGPNLAQTLEKYVYTDGFKAAGDSHTELILCNVKNPVEARGRDRKNEAEALCIQSFVNKHFTLEDSVAILAPYRAQIKRLKQLLPDYKDGNKILTVHKSQGKEWDTVIYSVCDIGNGKRPWFTDTQSLMSNGINNVNTAVSRAKKRLVIFCCKNDWIDLQGQLISGLLQACTKEIKYDTSNMILFPENQSSKKRTSYQSTPALSNTRRIKSKDYIPSSSDEQWESKTLFWSKKKLPGYAYSQKKKAWWKKK